MLMFLIDIFVLCLNPCFSGNRFGRMVRERILTRSGLVLILVLVEIGLGGLTLKQMEKMRYSLNPCFSGNRFGSLMYLHDKLVAVISLNPCFSGNRFGRTANKKWFATNAVGLNPCFSGNRFGSLREENVEAGSRSLS